MRNFILAILILATSVSAITERQKYRHSKYRVAANITVEAVTWVGLLLMMPDSRDYRKLWAIDNLDDMFGNGVSFRYTDGNSGFFTDKIAHPFLGSTIYGFLEQSGYHPFEALGLTCAHSILWEFKEYPKTGCIEMKDAVWTMVPSALYCLGDILANETNNRILQIIGNTLSFPSHTGKFLYMYTLGKLENRK